MLGRKHAGRSNSSTTLYDNERFLDREQLAVCEQISNNEPFIGMCRNLISSHILANGIDFVRKGKPLKLTPEFEHLVREYWVPFSAAIIEHMIAYGFVPVGLSKNRNGDRYPYVPEFGTYYISVMFDDKHQKRFRFWWLPGYGPASGLSEARVDKNIVVFVDPTREPTIHGKLRSNVFRIASQVSFMNGIEICAARAEDMRSNPVVFTHKRDVQSKSIEGINYDFYADADAHEEREEDMYERDEESIKSLLSMERAYRERLGIGGGSNSTTKRDNEKDKLRARAPHQVPLPHDRDISSHAPPQVRTDLVPLKKNYQEEVCAMLGVPKSMVIADQAVRGNIAGMNETFKTTITAHKDTLVRILDRVYTALYGEEDLMRFVFDMRVRKNKETPRRPIEDESQLFEEFNSNNRVSVRFSDSPYASTDQLNFMYARGLLTWDDYYKYYLLANNIKVEQAPSEKDPWSREKRESLAMPGASRPAKRKSPTEDDAIESDASVVEKESKKRAKKET